MDPTPSTTPFVAQPFVPSIWPFPTKQSVAAWRANPSSIPWATNQTAVLQHYVTDVLKISDVTIRPHYGVANYLDVLVGSRRVTEVSMQPEADAQPVAWSVSGGVGHYASENVPQTGGNPMVVSGYARRQLPVHLTLLTLGGRVLSRATADPVPPTYLEALPSPTSGRVVVEVQTQDLHGIDSLDFYLTDLFPQPTVTTRCGGTTLAVQAPRAMAYGETGSRSFGLTLANIGRSTCVLDGYLGLTVHDDQGRLPFTVRHGDSMFWHDPGPRRVVLQPGQVAVAIVDKYRCDTGAARRGTSLRLRLPGRRSVTLPDEVDYCKPSPDDPGNVLTMTALAGSMTALFRARP